MLSNFLRRTGWVALILVGGYSLSLLLAGVLSPFVFNWLHPHIGHDFDRYVDRLRWLGVLFLLPVWWRACGMKSFSEFGWRGFGAGLGIWGLAALSALAAALTGALLFGGGFIPSTQVPAPVQVNVLALVAKGLGVAFGVALLEEMIFRGVLQRIWIKGFGITLGIWMGAFAFAWLHGRPELTMVTPHLGFADGLSLAWNYIGAFPSNLTVVELINLTLFGGVLGLMYYKTRSLWLPIGFHAGLVCMVIWLPAIAQSVGLTLPSEPLIELPIATVLLGLWAGAAWLWPTRSDANAVV